MLPAPSLLLPAPFVPLTAPHLIPPLSALLWLANCRKLLLEIQRHVTRPELLLVSKNMGEEEAVQVFSLLQRNSSASVLDVRGNGIGPSRDVTLALGGMIRHNTHILTLDLSSNDLGVRGACAVSMGLQFNKTLKTLKMNCNRIRDDGAQALAAAVTGNATLTSLHVCSNELTDIGGAALVDAAQHSHSLEVLNLAGNQHEL